MCGNIGEEKMQVTWHPVIPNRSFCTTYMLALQTGFTEFEMQIDLARPK
jgi:hypothetical protein